MKITTASAPGKVVLSGEYAVLDGAPAVCMAVDCRAIATVGPFEQPQQHTSLVAAILDGSGKADKVSVNCDSHAFHNDGGQKLGLGSSAAVTVALLAALQNSRPDLKSAIEIHRNWQGGSGSGVDVACAVRGGLIEYTQQDACVTELSWPIGLEFRLIWSGVASSTGNKLAQLKKVQHEASATMLRCQASAVAASWREGSAKGLLATYPEYVHALRAFSVDHDLGIFDAGHDELVYAAAAENIVYKPCGAGGGDIGIALSTDAQCLDNFITRRDLQTVDCRFEQRGAVVE